MKASTFALVALMSTGATSAMALGDGSFEDPVLGSCCVQTFNVGQQIDAWTVIGPKKGKVTLTSTNYTKGRLSFPAEDGNQWLNISGGPGTGVVQKINVNPSTNYRFSFWVGSVYDATGKNGTSSTVQATLNGAGSPVTITAINDGKNKQQWEQFSVVFTCGCNKVTIQLVTLDPKSDHDTGIDQISFRQE